MDQGKQRRPHLTKEQRLPKNFKEVEKILNIVKKCEANVKTVLHNSKLRGAILHKVSGLTFNVLKQRRILDSIIERTQLLEKEPYLRKELAGILIHELIFGNGLPGYSKPVETILKHQVDITIAYNDLKSDDSLFHNQISIPKYVRVNTLVTTLSEVLEDLECLGVKQIFFEANISEEEFYNLVKNLEKHTFLLDYHFKDLIIFNGEENLTTWSFYRTGSVFIQDKSSYIPAYVLDPTPGATVIDACAAPGMKTLHLTALMENNGLLYAFEKDEHRYEILNNMLKSGHVNICQTFCGDFNLVDPRDEKYASVEYILLDPSCSGSGMVNRMDDITDTKESKNELRLQKLAGFQIILLKHALLFPSVKRVVYSTCSTTEKENEFVVHEVLNHFRHRFKLSHVLPNWSIRGSSDFEFGSNCLRAYPDKCFTNGFFVAMFERLDDSEEQYHSEETQYKHEKKDMYDSKQSCITKKSKKREKESFDSNIEINFGREEFKDDTTVENILIKDLEEEMPPQKKHKKHRKNKFDMVDRENVEMQDQFAEDKIKKGTIVENTLVEDLENAMPQQKKHKRKHKKDKFDMVNRGNTEMQDQFAEDKIKNGTTVENDLVEDIRKEMSQHKKKHKKDKLDKECIEIPAEKEAALKMKPTEEMPHKKKHKRKHDKEYTNMFESDVGVQDAIQNINLQHKKYEKNNPSSENEAHAQDETQSTINLDITLKIKRKNKKEHRRNHSLSDSQMVENSNVEDITLTESLIETQETNELHKIRKKHKKKRNNEDPNNHFSERQSTQEVKSTHKRKHEIENMHFCEAQLHNFDVENNVFPETTQGVEASNKKKKIHTLHKSQILEEQVHSSNGENSLVTETVQGIESSHKRKKHKKKIKAEND